MSAAAGGAPRGREDRVRQDVPVARSAEPGAVRVWSSPELPEADLGRTVATIGVFDGVHRGHQVILRRAVQVARAAQLPCVAVTFDPHPGTVLRPASPVAMLASVARRVELLHECGVDAVWVMAFTPELSRLAPGAFVADLLVADLQPSVVVVGANFRFGHRAAGDVGTLRELGERGGFVVESVALAGAGDAAVWSSTQARQAVAAGDVAAAAQILGRAHRLDGVVVHGDHRGRELGYPTANLRAAPDAAVPADGVYSGWLVRAGGQRLPAAISVGANPTFDGVERRAEAYVLDGEDLDLYGEHVGLEFAQRLRPMERFDTVEELVRQMAADVATARRHVG